MRRGEQASGIVNECLQGSTLLAAASHSPKALHLGVAMVLSLIVDVSKRDWIGKSLKSLL